MQAFTRSSSHSLSSAMRLWLLVAAMVLLLTSVVEAGHIHGTFTDVDDHCTLCQHSVALDKILPSEAVFAVAFLLFTATFTARAQSAPVIVPALASIRAPPVQLQRR